MTTVIAVTFPIPTELSVAAPNGLGTTTPALRVYPVGAMALYTTATLALGSSAIVA